MLGLLLTVLRYLFLFLLYAFLFVVVRQMFLGLRENPTPAAAEGGPGSDTKPFPGYREATVSKPSGRLVVLASPDPRLEKGMTFYLGERITLGRGEHNDLVIPDPFSSQEHAVIFSRGDQYWVQDLGSLNGTYLNEVRLDRPTVLADGDRLRIGGVTFQFVRWAYEVESS
ncbi:FHA domain-containing protein [Desulfofundulus thermosubterraneus]|uniref:Forkhead associated (FHA) domain, binds pSer, pThr, pTyr n=1 Tax=Desulfofundulus thermosubterraneus DSM 16057 TaxID=1121432 RepID=A0A1M6BPF0_9FIRM|nr:FHA domain-containing protein [Desulfofundulus thermosubterraneus]SHI50494.1 Forkhead associated (FHA) domain, binds pSer, pThr, pTyr [Desulfofundulus thermosubterraneus DSM 16057]